MKKLMATLVLLLIVMVSDRGWAVEATADGTSGVAAGGSAAKAGKYDVMVKVCGLTSEQQQRIADLDATMTKAAADYQAANAKQIEAAKASVASAGVS